jgi:hypothetical protein
MLAAMIVMCIILPIREFNKYTADLAFAENTIQRQGQVIESTRRYTSFRYYDINNELAMGTTELVKRRDVGSTFAIILDLDASYRVKAREYSDFHSNILMSTLVLGLAGSILARVVLARKYSVAQLDYEKALLVRAEIISVAVKHTHQRIRCKLVCEGYVRDFKRRFHGEGFVSTSSVRKGDGVNVLVDPDKHHMYVVDLTSIT